MARKRGKQNPPSPSPKTPPSSHDPKSNEKPVLSNTSPQGTTDLHVDDDLHGVIKLCGANLCEVPIACGVFSREGLQHEGNSRGAMNKACAASPLEPGGTSSPLGLGGTSTSLGNNETLSNVNKSLVAASKPIDVVLLDEQESEFAWLMESIDAMDESQASAVLKKLDQIREKVKGKKPFDNVVGKSVAKGPNPKTVVDPKAVADPKSIDDLPVANATVPNRAFQLENPTAKETRSIRASVWETFDISKLRNSGEKLTYHQPTLRDGVSVKEGLIPPERVDDSELHPIVANVKQKEDAKEGAQAQNVESSREGEW
ncbi:hypothetical protein RIF29_27719 [Crotalaria pallida]|uniref:Uncharacterized protein n=1 Tax=Crotalaria pallida TaxID=3830 RepID=A0AAN9EQK2_CROPI